MRTLMLTTAVVLGGCGTLFTSNTRSITVQSNVPGAQITIDGVPAGTTPARLEVDNHKSHIVVVTGPSGQSSSCRLSASVGGGWVILDILAGLVPIIIDAVTGDWVTLNDTHCFVNLATAPGAN
jgi:hypothetical protein